MYRLYSDILAAPLHRGLAYQELDAWPEIQSARPEGSRNVHISMTSNALYDQIHGGWLGRIAGVCFRQTSPGRLVCTGIEYQVAAYLIVEGMVPEGLAIVRAARAWYDGHTRNPWNGYECGDYYTPAMASYALLIASGSNALFKPRPGPGCFALFFLDRQWLGDVAGEHKDFLLSGNS